VKLLFDQNISFRLINKISEKYPEAKQVRQLGLENYSDTEIWNYAYNNGYTIVTFDADFYDLANLEGHPPKIIWLRLGNTSIDILAHLFLEKYEIIKNFIENPKNQNLACLEIDSVY